MHLMQISAQCSGADERVEQTTDNHSCAKLEVDTLGRITTAVSLSPMLSLLSMLTVALRGRFAKMPMRLRQASERMLTVAGHATVAPLAEGECSVIPSTVMPVSPGANISMNEQIDRLRAVSADELLRDIELTFGRRIPARWQVVVDEPRSWLLGYTRGLTRAWRILEPLWQHMDFFIHREIERVAIATVRGRNRILLNGLSPHVSLQGPLLYLPGSEPAGVTPRGRSLILAPMIAASGSLITSLDHTGCVWIAYPLPALADGRAADSPSATSEGALDRILGGHRATILRLAGCPLNMGELAQKAYYSAGTLTYHCNLLVKAGLLERVRAGRHMLLARTGRGDALLELFEEDTESVQSVPGGISRIERKTP